MKAGVSYFSALKLLWAASAISAIWSKFWANCDFGRLHALAISSSFDGRGVLNLPDIPVELPKIGKVRFRQEQA